MSNLKTVHYLRLHNKPEVGGRVLLEPIDHPSTHVSNTNVARTSLVTWVAKDGHIFHTENSRYVPLIGNKEYLNEDNPGSVLWL